MLDPFGFFISLTFGRSLAFGDGETTRFNKGSLSVIFPSLHAGLGHAALDHVIHHIWTKEYQYKSLGHSIENVLTAAKLIANCNISC
jgi:hypothetical protein